MNDVLKNIIITILTKINELNIPKIILIPMAILTLVYALWKIADITQRMSNRTSNSEKNIRRRYNDAKWRLETGNFDKHKTKEFCTMVVEKYKDGIPKDNKLKKFVGGLLDWIKLFITIIVLFLMYCLIRG